MFRTRWKATVRASVALLIVAAFLVVVGTPLWVSISVAAIAGVLAVGDHILHGVLARRDRRVRTRLSFEQDRRCKGCNGDLWGLDVLPVGGGRYKVKCPECGVLTEFRAGRVRGSKPRKRQWDEADTRSFKIR